MLLTGNPGVGKSLFCKYLQKALLYDWNPKDSNSIEWLPLYIRLSILKQPKTSAVIEALTQELQLTEEQVYLLQNIKKPRLLFLFDGYEEINEFKSFESDQDYLVKNFYTINKFGEDSHHAKFIIVCREKDLFKVSKRDDLFPPIDPNTGTAIPGSFLERIILPFRDCDIVSYLKKYIVFGSRGLSQVTEDSFFSTKSWGMIDDYERLIDEYHLRDLVRVPFNLCIATQVLLNLGGNAPLKSKECELSKEVSNGTGMIHYARIASSFAESSYQNEASRAHSPRIMLWNLYEYFTDYSFESALQRELDADDKKAGVLLEDLKQKAEGFALQLLSYNVTSNCKMSQDLNTINMLLTSCGLLRRMHVASLPGDLEFQCKLLPEFFVAKAIVNEIRNFIANQGLIPNQSLLLNQKLLNRGSPIVDFLVDSIHAEKVSTSDLLKIVLCSRTTQSKKENNLPSSQMKPSVDELNLTNLIKEEEKSPSTESSTAARDSNLMNTRTSLFAIAAANAMTILNASNHDFRDLDLSYTHIPGACLCYGLFENTDFSNANLEGVDFTGAWLHGTNFSKARMAGIELGIFPEIRLKEKIKTLAFSDDGKKLFIAVRDNMIIFDKDPVRLLYREVRRFELPSEEFHSYFSRDGTKFVLINRGGGIQVWEVATGVCLQEIEDEKILGIDSLFNFDSENPIIILHQVKNYKRMFSIWTPSHVLSEIEGNAVDLSPDSRKIIGESNDSRINVWNSKTGKSLFRLTISSARRNILAFNSDGRQISSDTYTNSLFSWDAERGHLIKQSFSFPSAYAVHYSTISLENKSPLDRKKDYYIAQNVKTLQWGYVFESTPSPNYHKHSFHDYRLAQILRDKVLFPQKFESIEPCGKQIAALKLMNNRLYIWDTSDRWHDCRIKGANKSQLNLTGSNIDAAEGLFEGHAMLFRQLGDYQNLSQEFVEKFILSTDPEQITEVSLKGEQISDSGARLICKNTSWTNLRKLDLSENGISGHSLELIWKNKTWLNLEEIHFGNNKIGMENITKIIAINASLIAQNIRIINLSGTQIGSEGVVKMVENEIWPKLEEFYLNNNRIGDAGAIALATKSHWKSLKVLGLTENGISEKGVEALVKKSIWIDLEKLYLDQNQIRDDGCIVIAKDSKWKNLKVISLSNNNIYNAGASTISKSSAWPNLEELYLNHNCISDKGALFIINCNNTWPQIKVLELQANEIECEDEEFIEAENKFTSYKNTSAMSTTFSRGNYRLQSFDINFYREGGHQTGNLSLALSNLRCLNLADNWIGELGAIFLSKNSMWRNIEEVNLANNAINEKGAEALSHNTSWLRLRVLNLGSETQSFSRNRIGSKGAFYLSQNVLWRDLETLNLSTNKIGDLGVAHLCKNTTWLFLKMLNLAQNEISDEGVVELSKKTSWEELREFDLGGNKITNFGAFALAKNQGWGKLQTLNLAENSIDANGALELSKNTAWLEIKMLKLYNNPIEVKGKFKLRHCYF